MTKNVPANSVEAYTLALAKDKSSTFAKNIDNFIACTKESREIIPANVMRNIRQFTNGMKNYLVKHGEADFLPVVDKARLLLKPDEFLNLDAILERVMHQLIILPLREHMYNLLVDFYARSGDIQAIINNVKYAETKPPSAFGIRVSFLKATLRNSVFKLNFIHIGRSKDANSRSVGQNIFCNFKIAGSRTTIGENRFMVVCCISNN